jgi:hypothetical protein
MSTSVEQFKQLYRISDVRGVAILIAVIGLGLSAVFSTAVMFHGLFGSLNVYFPNLDDKDPVLMIEPIFWIAAFVLLLVGQRRFSLFAGALGSLLSFVEVIRQATDGAGVFSYQWRPIQFLCIGIVAAVALFVAKDAAFPAMNKFKEIASGIAVVALVLMLATKPWEESAYSIVQSGWSLDLITELVVAVLYVGAFALLWKNARYLIAVGMLLGVAQLVATFVSYLQNSLASAHILPTLLTNALWIALPVALGNLVLSQGPAATSSAEMPTSEE